MCKNTIDNLLTNFFCVGQHAASALVHENRHVENRLWLNANLSVQQTGVSKHCSSHRQLMSTNFFAENRLCLSFVLTGVEVNATDVSRFKNWKKDNFHCQSY